MDNLADPRFEQTVTAYYDALSAGDQQAWLALFAADATSHDPVGTPPAVGSKELPEIWNVKTAPFEKLTASVESAFFADTGAAVKWKAVATSAGGGGVTFEGISVFEFTEEGHIQTVMAYWDPAAMLIALADSEAAAE